jgi:hypothetical protein
VGKANRRRLIRDLPQLVGQGPVHKMVAEFEASVKKHPLIAMGTPDPYTPPR